MDDYWPCACVKRPRGALVSTHIKMNHKSVSRCRKCGATRADAERFSAEFKAKGSSDGKPVVGNA